MQERQGDYMYSMETYLDDDRLPVIEKTKICEEKVTLNNPETNI